MTFFCYLLLPPGGRLRGHAEDCNAALASLTDTHDEGLARHWLRELLRRRRESEASRVDTEGGGHSVTTGKSEQVEVHLGVYVLAISIRHDANTCLWNLLVLR